MLGNSPKVVGALENHGDGVVKLAKKALEQVNIGELKATMKKYKAKRCPDNGNMLPKRFFL